MTSSHEIYLTLHQTKRYYCKAYVSKQTPYLIPLLLLLHLSQLLFQFDVAVAEHIQWSDSYLEADWLHAVVVSLEWLCPVSCPVSAGIPRKQLGRHQWIRGCYDVRAVCQITCGCNQNHRLKRCSEIGQFVEVVGAKARSQGGRRREGGGEGRIGNFFT